MSSVAHPDIAPADPDIAAPAERRQRSWPLERALFLMAGTVTGLSALLAATVSPWFLLLTGFVAVNQLAFVAFGHCGASLVLRHAFGFRSAVYGSQDAGRGCSK